LQDEISAPPPPSALSIRSLPLERSRATAIVEGAVERIALNAGPIDPPSKCQHVPGLRSNHKVLFIDRAFHTARLIRSFEMTFDHKSLLLKFQVLRGGCSVRILAVQSPLAGNYNRHKSERAISLARPRPLCSDFRRSGSDSRSQRLSSRNHSAPTSDSPCFYLILLRSHSLQELLIAVRLQLPGPSLVADSRRPPFVRSLLLEDHSSSESNTTLQQWQC